MRKSVKRKSNKKHKNLVSILLTILVIALYLLPNFVSAVSVRVKTDKDSYENSEVVTFDVSVDIEDGERVPVQHLTLKINETLKVCTFRPDGTLVSGCENMKVISKHIFDAGYGYGYDNYGYGYGYGYQHLGTPFATFGYGTTNTTFGYGYGYGSGYGYGYGLTFPSELSYLIEWDIGKEGIHSGRFAGILEAFAKNGVDEFTYLSKDPTVFDISGDNLLGNLDDVATNIPDLTLEIDGSTNLTNLTGVRHVVFKQGDEILLEFDWDFSSDVLDLSEIAILLEFTNGSQKFMVDGISLPAGVTKTAYLNQTNTSLNSVCVYDHEIASISVISGSCAFGNETSVECNGVAQSGFTCTDLGTRLKVAGLKHTGLNQISFSAPISPAPSGGAALAGGGGGGGGGGAPFGWQCTEWSACSSDGIQTRSCSLLPGIGAPTKPAESQSCTYTGGAAPATEGAAEGEGEEGTTSTSPVPTTPGTEGGPTGITGFAAFIAKPINIIGAIIVLILVGTAFYAGYSYLYKKKR